MPRSLAPGVVAVALAAAAAVCAPSPASLDRLIGQAELELRRGRVDEAWSLAQEGHARAERTTDAIRTWRFGLLMAEAHLARLEFPAALTWLERAVPDAPEFRPVRARQLLLLARTRVSQGQLAPAQPLVDSARALAGEDGDLITDIELLQSQLLYRSGRASEADALLAASRARVVREGDEYRHAQVSTAIGMGLVTRGRYDEALPFFESILDLPQVEGTSIKGAALNNAGLCHARLGQFERAVALQEEAIRIQQQGRKRDHAQALGELGSTYLLQDDFSRGAEYLQQAFAIAAGAGLASDAALFARNLAAAHVAMGRWDDAARFNGEASRFGAQASGTPSPYGIVTQAQVAAGRARFEEAEQLFRQALEARDATPGVRWVSYDGLARLAAARNEPAEAARHFEAALQTVEQTRSALLRADYRISFTSRLIQFYRGYVDLLLSQGQIERALEVADSSRGRVLAERQGVAAPTVRATAASLKQIARRTGATLLFYWLGPSQSWVWTVTDRGIDARPLPPGPQIEAMVAEHQTAIQDALADPLAITGSVGDRLYELLLGPLGQAPSAGRSVVIVPDGALHRLNFETLPVPVPTRHYWIDDVSVQIAPSLAMLRHAPGAGAAAAGRRARAGDAGSMPGAGAPAPLLLIGNAAPRPPEFPPLSYAPAEMAGITKHFGAGAVSVIEGDRASPASFAAADPGRFAMIHFTAHAVANVENPLDSAVILSGPEQAYKLYARDVAALPLAADLVTVSACRSAGERAYAGEGLVGFAWAFLRAGSRRVVAGLWDVDDRSTAALMEAVYARLAAGDPPPLALREAKRALMRQGFARPYYWAPFQMFTVVL